MTVSAIVTIFSAFFGLSDRLAAAFAAFGAAFEAGLFGVAFGVVTFLGAAFFGAGLCARFALRSARGLTAGLFARAALLLEDFFGVAERRVAAFGAGDRPRIVVGILA